MNNTNDTSLFSRNIILILIAAFSFMLNTMATTPLIAGFSETLGASAGMMGLISALMTIVALVCRPVLGNITDRMSKYLLSMIGSVLMIFGCMGYILAQSPAHVVAARIIHGFGYACCTICMSTWMSTLLPKEKLGAGMGIYGTANALAMAVAPSLALAIYHRWGYRLSFAAAILSSVLTLIVVQFITNKGLPKASESGEKKKLLIFEVRVLPIALIVMLFTLPYFATQAFIVRYVEVRELSVNVSLFFPVYAISLLLLRITLRNLFDKIPFIRFVLMCSASAGISCLCLCFMQSNLLLVIAAVCMAGGYGLMCSVSQSTAFLIGGENKRGLANSTYYIGLDSGMALGPIVGGFLYGYLDLRLFYPTLLLTLPLILLSYYLTLCKKSPASSAAARTK